MGIRVVPNMTIPHAVYRYLLPHEGSVVVLRLHWARLIPSLTMAVGGLFAATAVQPAEGRNNALTLAVWLLAAVLIAQLGIVAESWWNRYLVITPQRIMVVNGGFLGSGVRLSLPLSQVQDVRLVRLSGGRLYGYGSLVFDSANVVLRYVPYPEQVYLEIAGLLFKDPELGE
jgi:hypothetical protein